MGFRKCFTRRKTFEWFIVIVVGFMIRNDNLGVTSVMRMAELPQTVPRHFTCRWRLFFRMASRLYLIA